jgi:hypothetical protein
MAALDWQSRVDDLNALTPTGADEKNRDQTVSRLTDSGTGYDTARTSLGPSTVDAAQAAGDSAHMTATSAWVASTQPAHERGDACARFILGSGSAIAFATDGSAETALLTRMSDAKKALTPTHPKISLKEELAAHERAVLNAYAAKPVGPTYGPPYDGVLVPALDRYVGGKGRSIYRFEVEELGPLIAEADLLLTELAFT